MKGSSTYLVQNTDSNHDKTIITYVSRDNISFTLVRRKEALNNCLRKATDNICQILNVHSP
jgi:hypothetical protein